MIWLYIIPMCLMLIVVIGSSIVDLNTAGDIVATKREVVFLLLFTFVPGLNLAAVVLGVEDLLLDRRFTNRFHEWLRKHGDEECIRIEKKEKKNVD